MKNNDILLLLLLIIIIKLTSTKPQARKLKLLINRPRRFRSAVAYSRQTFPGTICRSVCLSVGLSSALWKNGRSDLDAV